ncbi:response regulator [Desulfopila sp. IMCC35006]|uniref:hybrid sensor histidine kinase/response regulator n=1 Tax=Desulfopila sp. IMCC35006 TaxID=2569542 RepID=UPI0010AC4367|nr:response regulator [Desulfopila sp. IMCC35006]TKB27105.1 response regulator [Desulfopila sp. IMCC35006]
MHNLKLRPAIALVLLIGFLIPVLFASQLTLLAQKHVLMQELKKEHARRLEILALAMQEPVWTLLPETGLPLVEAMMTDKRMISIKVISEEGVFIEKHSSNHPPPVNILTGDTEIFYHGRELGRVSVAIDTSPLERTIASQSSRYLAIILVPFILSIFILFFLLRRKIINPIELLITQSEDLARKKLEKEFYWKQEDEIGLLGRSLEKTRQSLRRVFADLEKAKNQAVINASDLETSNSQLTEQISERIKIEQELRLHKQQLEQIVQQRTAELIKTNENLIREMKEKKKAEDERRNIEVKLHRAEKMEALGLLASGVAHDLNNILAGIVSYPEILLLRMDKENDLYKPLETIHSAGQRAASVVSDLLTIARNAATVRVQHNLNDLVQEYFSSPEFFQLQNISDKTHVELILEAHKPYVLCSTVHVKKCLMNLVTNSVEAIGSGKRGTITVSTYNTIETERTENQAKEIEYIVLSIADDGPGIAEKDLENIFEPFYSTKQMGRSGSGLGLAVVWSSMQEHNGKVSVSSNSEGSCFKLYFPQAQVQDNQSATKKKETYIQGKNRTVLVVDDEPLLLTIAEDMLAALGFRVVTVSSGEEAVEFLQTATVDLVMLDMVMEPGINGRQIYEQIQRIHPGQKAFIVSGFAMNDDIQAALDLGVRSVLQKPYAINELSEAMKLALDS